MAIVVVVAQVGGVIERLEAMMYAINDARMETAAIDRELPAMLSPERLVAERRRLHLRREIAKHASALRVRKSITSP